MEKEILELLKDIKDGQVEIKKEFSKIKEELSDLKSMFSDMEGKYGSNRIELNSQKAINELPENELVKEILVFFRERMDSGAFETWIKPTVGKAYLQDNLLIIPCNNMFFKNILEERYLDLIKEICTYDIKLVIKK